ncbi:kinesin-like protein KIF20B [Centruroides vittatus]|uniref:kinesin-like protein KIF20B n=1 Tax=Centruroides vittatus TaxID=120091 RepID=UPI00350FA4C5
MEGELPSKTFEEIQNEDLTSSFNLQSLSTIVDDLIEPNVSLQDCNEVVDQACYPELTRKSGENTVENCNLSLSLVEKNDNIADVKLSSTPIKQKFSTKNVRELSDIIVDNLTCGEETNHNNDRKENIFTSCNSPKVSPIAKVQISELSLSASAAVENQTKKNENTFHEKLEVKNESNTILNDREKGDFAEQLTEGNKNLSLTKEKNVIILKEGSSVKSENFEPSRKQTQSNKIEKIKKPIRIVRNRISSNKDNHLENRNDTKTGESSVKESKKPKYVIEDPVEIGDINDPEWENIRCLNTDDERYRAVKACWGSKSVPNPNKDLTRHNYRLRKMKEEGYKESVNDERNRKRTATSEPVDMVDNKRRKVETAFCTEILDRKIDQEYQLYKKRRDEEEQKYFIDLQKVNYEICKSKQLLEQQYLQKIEKTKSSSSVYNSLSNRVREWKISKEIMLRDKESREIEIAKRRFADANKRLEHNYNVTLNKLKKAREEVLKFNQFYCGLSNLNSTLLEGKRLEEVRLIEEMYNTYDKVYAPARM